jgi:hypothetical protein
MDNWESWRVMPFGHGVDLGLWVIWISWLLRLEEKTIESNKPLIAVAHIRCRRFLGSFLSKRREIIQ